MAKLNLIDRILKNIELDANDCWNWNLSIDKGGYGHIKIRSIDFVGRKLAHRVSYEVFVSDIPEGLQIDHLCRNRGCVNPDHLEPVTGRENKHRGLLKTRWEEAKKITHCPQGHEYTPKNTYIKKNVWGNECRNCRACAAARTRRWHLSRKLATGAV